MGYIFSLSLPHAKFGREFGKELVGFYRRDINLDHIVSDSASLSFSTCMQDAVH